MSDTARDVMTTELITVTPSTSLADFARICAEDGISGAPVVRVDGTLVGMVSKTDLVSRLLEDHPKFGSTEEFPTWADNLRQVDDIMQSTVATVSPETPLPGIAAQMARERIHRVVVMEGDRPVGIVTSIDLLGRFPS